MRDRGPAAPCRSPRWPLPRELLHTLGRVLQIERADMSARTRRRPWASSCNWARTPESISSSWRRPESAPAASAGDATANPWPGVRRPHCPRWRDAGMQLPDTARAFSTVNGLWTTHPFRRLRQASAAAPMTCAVSATMGVVPHRAGPAFRRGCGGRLEPVELRHAAVHEDDVIALARDRGHCRIAGIGHIRAHPEPGKRLCHHLAVDRAVVDDQGHQAGKPRAGVALAAWRYG